MSDIVIDISNETSVDVDVAAIREAVAIVLEHALVDRAAISVVVVDNEQIWDLNRKYLDHDYATDVLSFRLNDDGLPLEGEVIVSREMAIDRAAEFGDTQWTAARELLLYVIHGTLHLVGHLDHDESRRIEMHKQERAILDRLGILSEAAFTGRSSRESIGKGETTS